MLPRCLENGLVGGGPEDALLKQPLRAPALAGSSIRRCGRIFIQYAYNRAGVRDRWRPAAAAKLAEFKGLPAMRLRAHASGRFLFASYGPTAPTPSTLQVRLHPDDGSPHPP